MYAKRITAQDAKSLMKEATVPESWEQQLKTAVKKAAAVNYNKTTVHRGHRWYLYQM